MAKFSPTTKLFRNTYYLKLISLTQLFYGRTLPSFSTAERTCVAIFFLRWPNEHV